MHRSLRTGATYRWNRGESLVSVLPSEKGRVLVLGASGFVGRHVVRALAEEGWDVVAFDRDPFPYVAASGSNIEAVQGDAADADQLRAALRNVRAVCHAAAYIPADYDASSAAETCFVANSLLTLRIAEAAIEAGVRRFLYFSTSAVYGYHRDPVTESAALLPIQSATYYAVSKLAGEIYLQNLGLHRALSVVILRLGSCFGPGMPVKTALAHFVDRASAGKPLCILGDGLAAFDYVFVEDVAAVTASAIGSDATGIFNVGTGMAYNVHDLARIIREVFKDRDVQLCHEAAGPEGRLGLPALNAEKAAKAWGFRARSLPDGLRDYRNAIEEGDALGSV